MSIVLPQKQHLQIVFYRAKALLKAEGSRTYLSFLWWAIDPLLELFIFYVVFGLILQRGGPGFVMHLLTGIFIVRLFTSATGAAPSHLLQNAKIILSLNIPKYIFPVSSTIVYGYKFLFLLFLLYAFLLGLGVSPGFVNLYVLPLTILYLAFIFGLAMFLSGITPFFPDLTMLYPKITMLLYWGSGVFFIPKNLSLKSICNGFISIRWLGSYPHIGIVY